MKIPVVSNSDCKDTYGSLFTDNMLCAGPTKGGKGGCQVRHQSVSVYRCSVYWHDVNVKCLSMQGDGGGPMLIHGSQWIQTGIMSFGVECAAPKFPGVFSRVSQYQSWISSQISSDPPGFVEFKSSGFRSSTSLPLFSLSLTFSIFPLIFSLFC